jgi:hypothetical protein
MQRATPTVLRYLSRAVTNRECKALITLNADVFKYPEVSVYAYIHDINTRASKIMNRVKLSEQRSSSLSADKQTLSAF